MSVAREEHLQVGSETGACLLDRFFLAPGLGAHEQDVPVDPDAADS